MAQVDVLCFTLVAYKLLIPIKAISVAYQVVIDAITKCLRLFAEGQQYLHSSSSFTYC